MEELNKDEQINKARQPVKFNQLEIHKLINACLLNRSLRISEQVLLVYIINNTKKSFYISQIYSNTGISYVTVVKAINLFRKHKIVEAKTKEEKRMYITVVATFDELMEWLSKDTISRRRKPIVRIPKAVTERKPKVKKPKKVKKKKVKKVTKPKRRTKRRRTRKTPIINNTHNE